MTARQKAFCEHYAACGNATQAAREAGYSEKTARSQGQRLLTDVDILRYVRELQDQAAAGRIASMLQVRAFWSDVLNNPAEKTADRLRAGELLAKAAGRSSMSAQVRTMTATGCPWGRLTVAMW